MIEIVPGGRDGRHVGVSHRPGRRAGCPTRSPSQAGNGAPRVGQALGLRPNRSWRMKAPMRSASCKSFVASRRAKASSNSRSAKPMTPRPILRVAWVASRISRSRVLVGVDRHRRESEPQARPAVQGQTGPVDAWSTPEGRVKKGAMEIAARLSRTQVTGLVRPRAAVPRRGSWRES